MHCKACDAILSEKDYFQLPDGSENDLCHNCLDIIEDRMDIEDYLLQVEEEMRLEELELGE